MGSGRTRRGALRDVPRAPARTGGRDRFVAAYGAVDDDAQRYWDVLDCVGYLPDPTKVATPWREAGRDVSDALARGRLEEHLGRVLAR